MELEEKEAETQNEEELTKGSRWDCVEYRSQLISLEVSLHENTLTLGM